MAIRGCDRFYEPKFLVPFSHCAFAAFLQLGKTLTCSFPQFIFLPVYLFTPKTPASLLLVSQTGSFHCYILIHRR